MRRRLRGIFWLPPVIVKHIIVHFLAEILLLCTFIHLKIIRKIKDVRILHKVIQSRPILSMCSVSVIFVYLILKHCLIRFSIVTLISRSFILRLLRNLVILGRFVLFGDYFGVGRRFGGVILVRPAQLALVSWSGLITPELLVDSVRIFYV
jgi:hypothetical protein